MLYNILFGVETIAVLNYLQQYVATVEDEVELRIKYVDADMFYKVLKYLEKQSFVKSKSSDVSSVYSIDPVTSYRQIGGEYIKKVVQKFPLQGDMKKYTFFRLRHNYRDLVEYKISHSKEIKITNSEIASSLGTSRTVINRVLQDLKNKNLIKLARGTITIL